MVEKPKVYILASGTKTGGGSGFANLVVKGRQLNLNYEVVGVVCNIKGGGVESKAEQLGVPFFYFEGKMGKDGLRRFDAQDCSELIDVVHPRIMMSGWLKIGEGYDPRNTINIHPGSTGKDLKGSRPFAGKGMFGHYVHEAVMKAFSRGEITHTEVTIHAVTDEPDAGVPIARIPVRIYPNDTPELLAGRVNVVEHEWQPLVLEAWLNRRITIDEEGSRATTPFPS